MQGENFVLRKLTRTNVVSVAGTEMKMCIKQVLNVVARIPGCINKPSLIKAALFQ